MGDHRANIKIEFEMHGVKRETDMWINWCADYGGVDSRVVEFFEEAASEAMAKWHEECYRREAKQRRIQEEEQERQEYARLKAKYEEEQTQ